MIKRRFYRAEHGDRDDAADSSSSDSDSELEPQASEESEDEAVEQVKENGQACLNSSGLFVVLYFSKSIIWGCFQLWVMLLFCLRYGFCNMLFWLMPLLSKCTLLCHLQVNCCRVNHVIIAFYSVLTFWVLALRDRKSVKIFVVLIALEFFEKLTGFVFSFPFWFGHYRIWEWG